MKVGQLSSSNKSSSNKAISLTTIQSVFHHVVGDNTVLCSGLSVLCITYVCLTSYIQAVHILGLFPTAAKSQYLVSEALMKGLAARGHSVVMVSCFPQNSVVKNYLDVSVRPYRQVYNSTTNLNKFEQIPMNILQLSPILTNSIESTSAVLISPKVMNLFSSNLTFDVVFHELFIEDVFLQFAKKFQAPIISVAAHYLSPWAAERFTIPQNPSVVPSYTTGFSRRMNLFQRMQNAFMAAAGYYTYKSTFLPKSNEVAQLYFGSGFDNAPINVNFNVSLLFVNTHFTLFGARPYPPQVIEIGGVHVHQANPLFKVEQILKSCISSLHYIYVIIFLLLFIMFMHYIYRFIIPTSRRSIVLCIYVLYKQQHVQGSSSMIHCFIWCEIFSSKITPLIIQQKDNV